MVVDIGETVPVTITVTSDDIRQGTGKGVEYSRAQKCVVALAAKREIPEIEGVYETYCGFRGMDEKRYFAPLPKETADYIKNADHYIDVCQAGFPDMVEGRCPKPARLVINVPKELTNAGENS